MKTRKIVMSIALAATLAIAPALGGCSGDHYSDINFPAQDTSYVVTSQGGNAVSYGNYIYFINGSRGYDDTDGTNNVWNDVVKGALYRAELNGEKVKDQDAPYADFAAAFDSESGLEFKYTKSKDYFGEDINVVDVTKIAPKTIGTSGYAQGGIFIYDDHIYFATPHNEKSATGTVQTTLTDFFMMPLGGGEPTKIYTTSEGVDTSSSAYAFYKYGSGVYLVVNENGTIVSVRANPAKDKVDDPVRFEVNATSVYFPVRDTYYTGIDNNTPMDFIYFVRNVKDTDPKPASGTVIEAMRPDGTENFYVSKNGQTETIDSVRDGVIFYRTSVSGKTRLAYNSLHDDLMQYSPSYKAAQEKITDERLKNKQFSGLFGTEITDSITATYAYRPDANSNEVFFIGVTSSAFNRYKADGNYDLLYSGTGTPLFVANNYMYYSGSDSDFYRFPMYDNMHGFGSNEKLASDTTTATLGSDYAAGYFTYFGEVDQWADGYMYFYKVDGREGLEPQFVGLRASADIPTEDQIKEASGETETEE